MAKNEQKTRPSLDTLDIDKGLCELYENKISFLLILEKSFNRKNKKCLELILGFSKGENTEKRLITNFEIKSIIDKHVFEIDQLLSSLQSFTENDNEMIMLREKITPSQSDELVTLYAKYIELFNNITSTFENAKRYLITLYGPTHEIDKNAEANFLKAKTDAANILDDKIYEHLQSFKNIALLLKKRSSTDKIKLITAIFHNEIKLQFQPPSNDLTKEQRQRWTQIILLIDEIETILKEDIKINK